MKDTQKSNRELYKQRREPSYLKDNVSGKYIDLRTTNDIAVLKRVCSELTQDSSENGIDYVIVSWISPPFGIVKGYGVYQREESERLSTRSSEERWGFPDFGSVYDRERLERRIKRLEEKYKLKFEPAYQH